MKKNTILMILALGMMSGGFYNDTFAAAPNKLQLPDNQQRKLMKDNVKKYIDDTSLSENVLTKEKVRLPRWINWHTENGILTIPPKYTDIEKGAFRGMENVEHVVMSPNVRTISNLLFSDCRNLKSIDLQNVQSIGNGAFWGCRGLTSITIPKGVTSIDNMAFYGCVELMHVTIPDSVKSIGEMAFDCTSCTFTVPNDEIKGMLIKSGVSKYKIATGEEKPWWIPGDDGKIVVPGSVKQIEKYAFAARYDITSVEISEGVESIGEEAFARCRERLTSVTIPSSVKKIDGGAFFWCNTCTFVVPNDEVKELLIKSGVSKYRIDVGGKKPWWIPDNGKIAIPNDVGQIEYNTFANRYDITSVAIQYGVTSIDENAFYECKRLTSITIPSSVQSIGKKAFFNCNRLDSVTISNSNKLKSIDFRAFFGCHGLTSITIPDSVESIGRDAFFGCRNLKKIYVYSDRVKQLVIDSESEIDPNIIAVI